MIVPLDYEPAEEGPDNETIGINEAPAPPDLDSQDDEGMD